MVDKEQHTAADVTVKSIDLADIKHFMCWYVWRVVCAGDGRHVCLWTDDEHKWWSVPSASGDGW